MAYVVVHICFILFLKNIPVNNRMKGKRKNLNYGLILNRAGSI